MTIFSTMASQELINEIKQNVTDKFSELKSALMMREKLLLRQLDVINTTSKQQLQQQEDPEKLAGIEFFGDNEKELLAAIRNFGRFHLTNLHLAVNDVYLKNEDYIKPSDDHETMFKGLNQSILEGADEDESIVVDFSHHKTLMERNAKRMNESIINITLKEAKELIKQAKMKRETPVPPLNLEELDDEVESSIADVVSSLEANSDQFSNNKYSQTQQTSKQKRFKPKITINNCNGTINLRNIASLTINCSTEENVQAQIPVKYPQQQEEDAVEEEEVEEPSSSSRGKDKQSTKSKTLVESLVSSSSNTECTSPSSTSQTTTPNSLSNYSSNNSSRSQSKKQKSKKTHSKHDKVPLETKPLSSTSTNHQEYPVADSSSSNDVTCDFYNRLLNEIKKSINHQQKTRTKCSSADSHHQAAAATAPADSTSHSQMSTYSDYMSDNPNSRRLILKNFENLKIILEANSSGDEESFHPVQIEQWLAEIISETDLEPMQNTDILEHSKIHNESQET